MHQTAEKVLHKHIDRMSTEQPSQGCAKAVSLIQAVRSTSVNDIDNNGYVHMLVQCNCFTFVLTLIYVCRRTPLHWATVCENSEVIRALLAAGGTLLNHLCTQNYSHTIVFKATH